MVEAVTLWYRPGRYLILRCSMALGNIKAEKSPENAWN